MSFDAQGDSVSITWEKDYWVDVSGVSDPTTISTYDVITASGLPIVNKSVYQINNQIIPFVICKSKTATQQPELPTRWSVSASYKAMAKESEAENAPIAKPAAVTDITPQVVSSLGEISRVIYEDKTSPNPRKILTPTLNQWSEPTFERIPTLILRITQYEASITYEEMLERRFKVNQGQYRSQPRYKWLIENVEGVEVTVPLSGGDTTAALMTYTLVYSPLENGWKDDRALIDTHYYDGATGEKLPFEDGPGVLGIGLIDANGNKLANQNGEPEYTQYETFDDIDFSGFLQV